MHPALKRHNIEDPYEDPDESDSSDVPADHQNPDQGGIELSGYGIVNNDSRLEIGRDFKIVHVENNFHSPTVGLGHAARREKEKQKAKELKRALKRQRRADLSTLDFPQFGLREANTGDPHTATCQWFLTQRFYLDWLDETKFSDHHGILWIKGKPGAGKSTLMKYVLSQIRRDTRCDLVISFFFSAQGETLERSTIGLYRSLLLQLFNARPRLEELLSSSLTGRQWTIQSLESLFKAAIHDLEDPTLICFIDALDECEESQIRRMLSFLADLSSLSDREGNTRLLFCFSSRYYPNITIKNGLIVRLEDQNDHRSDISRYIDSILNIGNTELAEQIRADVLNSAAGVFMWVVLVVDILNREYDRGRPNRLRQRLQDMPKDLHDLFHDIIDRDENNPEGLICCIQWILFATRPLSPQEHYYATLCGVEPQSIPASDSEVSIEDMTRYILDISKGLAEIVGTEFPIVRFIHQSARDFLLNQNGIQKIRQDLGLNVQGHSHENLRACCAEYILSMPVREVFCQETVRDGVVIGEGSGARAEEAVPSFPFSEYPNVFVFHEDETVAVERIHARQKEIASRLPFLEYATNYILQHAEEAECHSISQSRFLSTFPRAMWIERINIYKHTFTQYSPNTTWLYILAEMNLPALIRAYESGQSCFAVEPGRFGAPILAALATGSGEAAQALLEAQARRLPRTYPGRSRISELVTREVNCKRFSSDFTSLRDRNITTCLAQFGSEVAFELFLATEDVNLDLRDGDGGTAMSWAARCGHEPLINLLLANGAGVDVQDAGGRTPLSWATGYGEVAVARVLLQRGAKVDLQDRCGWGPLSWAVAGRHKAAVRELLANGANAHLPDNERRTPLFLAATGGHLSICRILIEHGANVNAQDNLGRTPLSWAIGYNRKAIACLFLDEGARTDVTAYTGGDLLSWASRYKHTALARLLLAENMSREHEQRTRVEETRSQSQN
ncbi:putative NB-ARC and Ankyrin domain protein [Rosellinia necatrix]|uniref:Putative NB-ARC and Ankyrin domain protein n=1 Tax=Rosellinia necatrix TaxID=77044 RepID=A0A1S7UID3_ROSNE|nr:putative NB-ARC and Ankyrin domain protein [Rosellinia necatrix]